MEEIQWLSSAKSIPDLSGLKPLSGKMALTRFLVAGGSADHNSFVLQLNCVRLMDASIACYNLGRAYANQSIDIADQGIQSWFNLKIFATTQFESCILHFHRFCLHVDGLRAARFAEQDLKDMLPRGLFPGPARNCIRHFRDAIAHQEERAIRGELPQLSFLTLSVLDSGLALGSSSMSWKELAAWIGDGYAITKKVAAFVPSGSGGDFKQNE